jgi:hypothetical protein
MNKKIGLRNVWLEEREEAAGCFVLVPALGETAILGTRMWASEKNANDFLFARVSRRADGLGSRCVYACVTSFHLGALT